MKNSFFRYRCVCFLVLMISFTIESNAQTDYMVNSHVRITIGSGDSIIYGTDNFTIISLNDNLNEFSARFSLSPFAEHLTNSDSMSLDKSLLLLTFKGKFPVSSFSFYNDQNDTKTYAMNGLLSLNNISNPYTLYFSISSQQATAALDEELCNPFCYNYFNAKIFFIISFHPSDFGINIHPEMRDKKIYVEVGGGVINKLY